MKHTNRLDVGVLVGRAHFSYGDWIAVFSVRGYSKAGGLQYTSGPTVVIYRC